MKNLYSNLKLYSVLLILFQVFFSSEVIAQNTTLQEILRHALNADPTIIEAQANVSVAKEQTEISKAGHYPTVSLTNTHMLSQRHRDTEDRRRSSIGVRSQINIYSWGGIQASVERDKHKEAYYGHKLTETREQLGLTVAGLYLSALRAKETIEAYKKSLARHQKMLRDIQVIASYDEGRRSEVTELESRLLQVEATIAEQTRILQTTLSKLSRYSSHGIKLEDLADPFPKNNPDQFITKFRNPDLYSNPTLQAQNEELASARENVKVTRAKRLPSLNLEGEANNQGYEVYLGVSWNIIDRASSHAEDQSYYSEHAAKAKVDTILLEIQEQARTSEIAMKQNVQLLNVIHKQITAQKEVVNTYELQFQIAQRSLLDVLNSYQELTGVEVAEINAANDFRDAALSYLVSQSRISDWAGIVKLNLPK